MIVDFWGVWLTNDDYMIVDVFDWRMTITWLLIVEGGDWRMTIILIDDFWSREETDVPNYLLPVKNEGYKVLKMA